MTPAEPAITLSSVLGTWGKPVDWVSWLALALAAVAAATAFSRPLAAELSTWLWPHDRRGQSGTLSTRRFLTAVGFTAAFLSLGYVAHYLRGGPRIIDATSYFLQGKALAHGKLAWVVQDPTASFRGRFLLFSEPDVLGGIFPPGYPLLLAIGFRIGAPMVTGPALAAGIALASYTLARELALEVTRSPRAAEPVARFAAIVSVPCAVLRYHTSDTMAHGACAFFITAALAAVLAGRRRDDLRLVGLAGLLEGWVLASRPVSAISVGMVILGLTLGAPRAKRSALTALVAMVPGILLLLASQRAVTGDAFSSTQLAYYARSDGPAGCFRYGFGAGIGCLHEHGDFVAAHLRDGFGALAAAGVTLRRLRMHLADAGNAEPVTLLILSLMLVAARRSRGARAAVVIIVGQVLAYVPFYFDGNYPGGGARFYADVLPLELTLAAAGLFWLPWSLEVGRRAAGLLALMLVGFAVRGVHEHRALADREGGRPMYEPDLAREERVDYGLLFFDTDHGFNLAHDPVVASSHGVMAARIRDDDRDRILYDLLGHPASHAYRYHLDGAAPSIETWIPIAPVNDVWRFEAEADWPPLAQSGGWALPAWVAREMGASKDRVLELTPAPAPPGATARAIVEIELPLPPERPFGDATSRPRAYRVTPRVLLRGGGGRGTLRLLVVAPDGTRSEQGKWTWVDEPPRGVSYGSDLPTQGFDVAEARGIPFHERPRPRARLMLEAEGGRVALDLTRVEVNR